MYDGEPVPVAEDERQGHLSKKSSFASDVLKWFQRRYSVRL
jgi:hypothetical protein